MLIHRMDQFVGCGGILRLIFYEMVDVERAKAPPLSLYEQIHGRWFDLEMAGLDIWVDLCLSDG